MAHPEKPAPQASAPKPPAAPPDAPSTGSQIAELKAQLEAKDAALAKAAVDAAQLEAALKQSRSEFEALSGKLEQSGGSKLPDLGKGSYELSTSVTIIDRQNNRITPSKGDVVSLVEDIEPVVKKVAGQARVYAVDKAAVDELVKMGALRRS